MSASRKTKSRGRIRRERQLRKQRERIQARGEDKYVPKELSIGVFLKRQSGFIVFAVILVAVILGSHLLGPDKNATTNIEEMISPLMHDKAQAWAKEYPYGYKLFALTDREITSTSYDTFSDDFTIDWKKLSITRIQADQLKRSEEKIRIIAPQVRYLPQNIASRSMVTTTISRKKGMKITLFKFSQFEFVAEVIEDKEGYLFCLFGLKNA